VEGLIKIASRILNARLEDKHGEAHHVADLVVHVAVRLHADDYQLHSLRSLHPHINTRPRQSVSDRRSTEYSESARTEAYHALFERFASEDFAACPVGFSFVLRAKPSDSEGLRPKASVTRFGNSRMRPRRPKFFAQGRNGQAARAGDAVCGVRYVVRGLTPKSCSPRNSDKTFLARSRDAAEMRCVRA
jgi:hypothetical protein